MTMQHAIPDKKGLRNFGLTTGAIAAVLFGLLLPWIFGHGFPLWPWIVAGVLAAWALLAPATLRQVYRAWMAVGHVLGWINTRIILGLVFYLVVLPAGGMMRIFRKDPMARRFEARAPTYRVPSIDHAKNHLERPF